MSKSLTARNSLRSDSKKSVRRRDVMDLWSRPGYLIRRLHQLSVAIFHDEMVGLGLTPVQLGALIVASRSPDIEQSAIGEALGIDRVNTGDVISRLVKSGLLARQRWSSDKRYKLIRITEDGEALLKRSRKRLGKVQDRVLAPLNPADRELFLELVRRLINGINDQGRTPLDLG
jgi:MarR family transcriptional regulator, lower aerobic nicotinate degradation pathway regulator